ncbi:S49 family peptidase [Roseiconus lacunae]|uniref:S49 family peptidase n=1 Tax=Roseiconus lacunae TaxID=2605694 RepID=A0ABT7PEN8_9BACT|nr:S49 family peptidase [Roseiconus lacunae]MDM4014967.1 S49 family peptidase [Roseiconus lacunae]
MPKQSEQIDLKLDKTALALIPHLQQFGGMWMMEESRMAYLADSISATDLGAHMRGVFDPPVVSDYMEINDGVAVISVEGTLMKHAMSMGMATSTVLIRKAIRQATDDPNVVAILLAMESPGGTAAGTMEVAQEIQRARKTKPVYGHATDLMASACYWIGSQCEKLFANEMALVGSIGTYHIVTDLSGRFAAEGIKVHVIRAGEFKGAGARGTEVTPSQVAHFSEVISRMNDHFVEGVATGRNVTVDVARAWADGRTYIAADAMAMGLIDGVQSLEDSLLSARDSVKSQTAKRSPKSSVQPVKRQGQSMSKDTDVSAAVTPKDIRAACPGCSSDFVVACLDNQHSLERCQELHMESLAKENAEMSTKVETLEKDNATLKAKVEKLEANASSKGVGVEGMPSDGKAVSDGSASESFWSSVDKVQSDKGCTRAKAIQIVNQREPELRRAMLDEQN